MEDKPSTPPIDTINGIKFTSREIDILSCILGGRSAKKMASFLSLSPKTVENYISNIMFKLHLNSRESIMDFLEQSGKAPLLKNHYLKLLGQPPLKDPLGTPNEGISNALEKHNFISFSKKMTWRYNTAGAFILLSILGFTAYKYHDSWNQKDPIRSDLVIPMESVFLNRSDLMAQLDKAFKGKEGIQTVALAGFGGAGKTTTARQYAHQQNSSLIWEINAERKSNLIESFENLAHALVKSEDDKRTLRELPEIKNSAEREKRLVEFVKEHLKAQPHWFLIYDNVDNFTDIQKCFPLDPKTWGLGRIIITTRDSNIQNNKYVIHVLPIGQLNDTQKLDLFTKIMTQDTNTAFDSKQIKEAKKFLKNIPPFPLDISVAAYYLKTTNIPYDEYLHNVTQNDTNFINTQEDLLKEASNYTKTRYQIISSSVRHLIDTNKNFQDLLLFISLLDSQDIPRDLLNSFKDKLVVDSLMYNLKKYSLITNETSHPTLGASFCLHRNSQEIILSYMTRILEPEKYAEVLHHIIVALEDHFEDVINNEKYTKMQQLINHLNMFLSHDKLLPPLVKASLESELGCIHYFMDHHENALKYLDSSLIHLEKNPHKNDIRKARVLSHIAKVYREQGDYKKAENIFRKSILIYQASANPKTKSLELARTLAYLGSTCSELGNFEQATYFLNESLKINQNNSGSSLWKAWILIHLAFIDRQLGNYEDAKRKYEESLSIYRGAGNDKRTYRVMGSLSRVYYKLGDYQKSLALLEEGLDNYTKRLSDKDANAATLMIHLGNVYFKLKKYDKAKVLLEKSLEIHEKLFGKENVRTLGVLGNLGNVLVELGNTQKARELIEKTLISYEKHYGTDHLETAEVLLNLGNAYLKENKFDKAETVFLKSLKIYNDKNHPEAYIAFENLSDLYKAKAESATYAGNTLQSIDYNKKSTENLQSSLNMLLVTFPKNSPHIIRIQSKMGILKVK